MQESMFNNPEYCLLFERQAVAFNNIAERLEGLNLPRQTYEDLVSGLRELEDATETLTKFEDCLQVKAAFRQELAKIPAIKVNIDAMYNKEEVQIND